MRVNIAIPEPIRRAVAIALAALAVAASPAPARAQRTAPDSAAKAHADSSPAARRFHQRMLAGFVASILLHESSHFAASYLQGFHPHLGMDKWRPTVFSGIDENDDPHKQFVFSAAGLTIQDVLDEAILDIPHRRGGPFERGLLAGGIGTTLFYVTAGRNARVSDISVMARTSSLSKTQLSVIFGSVAALHTARVAFDHHYARFFAAPAATGGMRVGISLNSN